MAAAGVVVARREEQWHIFAPFLPGLGVFMVEGGQEGSVGFSAPGLMALAQAVQSASSGPVVRGRSHQLERRTSDETIHPN